MLFVRYFFYYKKEKIKLVHAKDLLNEAKENSRKIRDERDEFYKGFEKNKELLGYEHNTVEQLRNALSDLKKREFEEMRAELDIRTKYLEQKLRAEMLNKQEGEFNFKETMFKHGQEELSNNIIQGISVEEVTSPAVNALRDWVSLMAVNLYESAPDSVMDFLVKFSNDNNPLIRMNVIPVLDRIASDETVAILLKLYHDTDNRVQREVLKSLLELEKKIVNGEVKLQKDKVDQVNMILKNERSGGEWIF
ncbi:MAG: HEAT repeat domain-containing protein [Elusimicrobia bacterium]|nr:HEAT repeat domain-containing protein [Candidatus Liberimonas magnetica]